MLAFEPACAGSLKTQEQHQQEIEVHVSPNQKALLISFSWLTTTTLLGAMFIVALLPEDRLREYPSILDHLLKDGGHVLGFAAFAFFLRLSFLLSFGNKGIVANLGYAVGPLLAAFTELLQQHSPGREPNVIDFTLDVIGSIIGAFLALRAYETITKILETKGSKYSINVEDSKPSRTNTRRQK